MLQSGYGAPGRLMAADGPISVEWLACMMHQAPPGVVVLLVCYSGQWDESLHGLAELLSQAAITRVGMWVTVADRAALVYDVEFLRAHVSGRSVAIAHRVACDTGHPAQVAMEWPAMAGAAFLLPGLVNGYGKIERRLAAIEGRLTRTERGPGIEGVT